MCRYIWRVEQQTIKSCRACKQFVLAAPKTGKCKLKSPKQISLQFANSGFCLSTCSSENLDSQKVSLICILVPACGPYTARSRSPGLHPILTHIAFSVPRFRLGISKTWSTIELWTKIATEPGSSVLAPRNWYSMSAGHLTCSPSFGSEITATVTCCSNNLAATKIMRSKFNPASANRPKAPWPFHATSLAWVLFDDVAFPCSANLPPSQGPVTLLRGTFTAVWSVRLRTSSRHSTSTASNWRNSLKSIGMSDTPKLGCAARSAQTSRRSAAVRSFRLQCCLSGNPFCTNEDSWFAASWRAWVQHFSETLAANSDDSMAPRKKKTTKVATARTQHYAYHVSLIIPKTKIISWTSFCISTKLKNCFPKTSSVSSAVFLKERTNWVNCICFRYISRKNP